MPNRPTKADLENLLDSAYQKLQEAYDPRLSREEMASKVADVLDDLAPAGEADDEEDDDDRDDDDDTDQDDQSDDEQD